MCYCSDPHSPLGEQQNGSAISIITTAQAFAIGNRNSEIDPFSICCHIYFKNYSVIKPPLHHCVTLKKN